MNLDALSAILGALAAGAGQGAVDVVKDSTQTAITTSRDKLIKLVRGRLADDRLGEAKLEVYTHEPTPTGADALRGHLIDAGVDTDTAIATLAREILRAAGPSATGSGSLIANIITQTNRDNATGYQGGIHHHYYAAQETSGTASWDLLYLGASKYEIRNTGTADALDTTITGTVHLGFPDPIPTRISAGSGVLFYCEPAVGDGAPDATVEWTNPGSPQRRQWQRPLPH